MWDLNCLMVIYSRIIEDSQEFENPGSEGNAAAKRI